MPRNRRRQGTEIDRARSRRSRRLESHPHAPYGMEMQRAMLCDIGTIARTTRQIRMGCAGFKAQRPATHIN
jgi:hypothetical protein